MPNTRAKRLRRLIHWAILIAVIVLAERLLWPRYSRERYIDPTHRLIHLILSPPSL